MNNGMWRGLDRINRIYRIVVWLGRAPSRPYVLTQRHGEMVGGLGGGLPSPPQTAGKGLPALPPCAVGLVGGGVPSAPQKKIMAACRPPFVLSTLNKMMRASCEAKKDGW